MKKPKTIDDYLAAMQALTNDNTADRHVASLLGNSIRRRREQLNWKPAKLALRIGITFERLKEIEEGKARPTAAELYDIAVALDVPASFLFIDILRQTQAPTTLM